MIRSVKHSLILLILSTITIFLTFGIGSFSANADNGSITNVDAKTYERNISETMPITIAELKQNIECGKTFVTYFGHESCPYCRDFSKTLKIFLDETDVPVYYFDTSKVSSKDVDADFLNMMDNVIGLQVTPTIVLVKHGKAIHRYVGSDTSLESLMTLEKYRY